MTIETSDPKTALTFDENIIAAFMHYVRGIKQQDIAIMMGGVNGGRVNEACMIIRRALEKEGFRPLRKGWDRMNIEDLPLKVDAG